MEKKVKIKCGHCGKTAYKKTGHYNRAKKIKAKLFCSQKCFGLSRRIYKTDAQKKLEKAAYDLEYRAKNEKKLSKARREWFMKDYAANPEKYKKKRKEKQQSHNEYCRQPAYRAKKKVYDQRYRAEKHYGEFAEAFIALVELAKVVDNRRAKREQKIYNKSQKRKRNGKNIKRQELEKCSMGLYQPS